MLDRYMYMMGANRVCWQMLRRGEMHGDQPQHHRHGFECAGPLGDGWMEHIEPGYVVFKCSVPPFGHLANQPVQRRESHFTRRMLWRSQRMHRDLNAYLNARLGRQLALVADRDTNIKLIII